MEFANELVTPIMKAGGGWGCCLATCCVVMTTALRANVWYRSYIHTPKLFLFTLDRNIVVYFRGVTCVAGSNLLRHILTHILKY